MTPLTSPVWTRGDDPVERPEGVEYGLGDPDPSVSGVRTR